MRAGLLAWALAIASSALGQSTERSSVGWTGAESDNHSWQAWLSGNGRYVVFESWATNLVPNDGNGVQDVFVRDRLAGTTVRVSVAGDGTEADGESSRPAISHDGRFVVFQSSATNLVAGDTNGEDDVFVHDLQTGQTTRVSVDSTGAQADDRSIHSHISPDGWFVVFHSEATNLVAGDTNAQWDVFVHDRHTGVTTRDSVRTDGGQGNDWSEHATLSGGGRFVAYHSVADNLVNGDTNGVEDVFLFDRALGVTERISVGSGGAEPDDLSAFPNISPDGGFVSFESKATNLVLGDTNGVRDIFVYDVAGSSVVRVSVGNDGAQANGACYTPSISRDGRFVAFFSGADNLVPGDTNGLPDAFVRDLWLGTTRRVSVGIENQEPNGVSTFTTISAGGRYVAFQSSARNLVEGDTNWAFDVFVHDLGAVRVPSLLGP